MKIVRYIITFGYMGFIFYLSSRSWGGTQLFPHADKVIHICLYAVLGALCYWTLLATTLRGRAMLPHLAAAIATLYGVTDELHQLFVPGRSCDVLDLAADLAGAIIGSFILARIYYDKKNIRA